MRKANHSSLHSHRISELDESFLNSIRRKDDWGVEGYKIPTNRAYIEKPRTFRWVKQDNRKDSFLDVAVRLTKGIPGPTTYAGPCDWKKELSSMLYGGSPLKGKFLKGPKKTY